MFAKNLKEIESKDKKLLRDFSISISRQGDHSSFFGTRFEINIAASLVRKNIDFRKSESPDFRLCEAGCAIECTSVRSVSGNRNKNYDYKISSAINKKSSQKYAKKKTVLAIDRTNTLFLNPNQTIAGARSAMQAGLSGSGFGAILIFNYVYNPRCERFESNYLREDGESCDKELIARLDSSFPKGLRRVEDYVVPNEG